MNGPSGYNVRYIDRIKGGGSVFVTLAVRPSSRRVAWSLAQTLHLGGKSDVTIWRSGLKLGRCSHCGKEDAWASLELNSGICGRCET